jgi:hypothetical protein
MVLTINILKLDERFPDESSCIESEAGNKQL